MDNEPTAPYAIRQFEVETWIPLELFGLDISFTNYSSSMLVTMLVTSSWLYLATRHPSIIPGRLQASAEWLYEFVADTVTGAAGEAARKHVPIIFALFAFVFFGTLIGMTPMKVTFATHIIVTFGLALIAFGYVIWIAVSARGLEFFRNFLPDGTPLWIAPLIVFIEFISFLARPITLGVRLFANVLAGHMMIKLFGDFSVMIVDRFGASGLPLVVLPLVMMIVFYAFETIVVFIQSYIFILLTCVYIRTTTENH